MALVDDLNHQVNQGHLSKPTQKGHLRFHTLTWQSQIEGWPLARSSSTKVRIRVPDSFSVVYFTMETLPPKQEPETGTQLASLCAPARPLWSASLPVPATWAAASTASLCQASCGVACFGLEGTSPPFAQVPWKQNICPVVIGSLFHQQEK